MSDDTVRLSMVGQIVRRHWRVLALLAVAGALVGAGAALVFPPGYKTTSNVLMQGPRQPDELLTQTQIVTSSVVLDRSAAALMWQVSGTDLQNSVTASVSDGNVVKIGAVGDTAEHAQQLADQVAKEFVTYSTQLLNNGAGSSAQLAQEQRDSLRQQVATTNQRITDLSRSVSDGSTVESVQARTELQALRTSLEQAMSNLNAADAATSQGNMVVMGPAELPAGPAAPTTPQLIGGGALLFFLLGVLGHLFTARRDGRLRGDSEIAAALGAPVLGTIDVPEAHSGEKPATVSGRLRRLVVDDRPWYLPRVSASVDEINKDVRYRRVLNRLKDGLDGSLRLLVLVESGDPSAHVAAMRLSEAANEEHGRYRTEVNVVEIAAGRPTVPDAGAEIGVVVVLTVGTRTAWELVGIAEACADAGHEVVGVVLTRPVRLSEEKTDKPVKGGPSRIPEDRDAMAGSA